MFPRIMNSAETAETPDTDPRDDGLVFAVEHECRNCGNTWTDEHPTRTKVDTATSPVGSVKVINTDCDEFGQIGCDCCYFVACPVCELTDYVTVDTREPINDNDNERTA